MKDFKAEAYDEITKQWVTVESISFRFWKNSPSDGINNIKILGNDGVESRHPENIREIKFKECY